MGKTMRAIGLMSGTSMDGIDVALVETDGEAHVAPLASTTCPYDRDFRRALGRSLQAFKDVDSRDTRPPGMRELEMELTVRHADAVADFLAREGLARSDIDVIGFHGQTVVHKPDAGLTVQIGDGPELARLTGVDVVHDLRADDVAAGGQGAPLVPIYHRARLADRARRPIAVLNIGGVANLTWIGRDGEMMAFDTGPGSALINDWMLRTASKPFDEDGAAGMAGEASEAVVAFFLDHDYFALAPPKSLDRNTFFWDLVEGLSPEDGAATLSAMTAGAVVKACAHLPEVPAEWIVCGGGRHNRAITTRLAAQLDGELTLAEAAGLDGDSIEAEAWAYLAVRSVCGLPITFPGTTGVGEPQTGGRLARA